MKSVRLISIFIVGGLLTYLTFKSMHRIFFGEEIIRYGLMLIGIGLFFWTLSKDIKYYRRENRLKKFSLTFICLLFVGAIVTMEVIIQYRFNRPTLLKVFYDGDFNGTGIDFKTNGTYIFDNSAIGMSDYYFGAYKIEENRITLDRDKIDNLGDLRNLEIREKKNIYDTNAKRELYLFQVDKNGNIIDQATEYRVIIDNRNN